MAIELGEAYITILPATNKLAPAIRKELAAVEKDVSSSGKRSGGGFASALAGGFKKSIAGAGIAATLAGGMAIKGGISRLIGIEEAEAKLAGLGHTAKSVDKIMANALKSVKGTAYGLDEAATTAASAVAAGIEPGKELTKYLTMVADAATIAGTDMDEMGSIINKVTTMGKAQTENLNQLAERGIPIYQWLAAEYGVTQEALSEMVRTGKIDAETFNKVITENIGGAAQKTGNTTVGAFKNMKAALSRIGANFLTGLGFDGISGLFRGITDLLGPLEGKAGKAGEALGRMARDLGNAVAPKLKEFGTFLRDEVLPEIGKLGDKAKEAWKKIAPKALDFASAGMDWVEDFIGNIKAALDGGSWGPVGESLGKALGKAIEGAGKAVGFIYDGIKDLMAKVDWMGIGISVGGQAISFMTGLAVGLITTDPMDFIKAIGSHWQEVLWAAIILALAPVKLIGAIGKGLAKIPFVGKFLSWLLSKGKSLADGVKNFVVNYFIKPFGKAFMDNLKRFFPRLFNAVGGFTKRVVGFFKDLRFRAWYMWNRMWEAIGNFFKGWAGYFGDLVSSWLGIIYVAIRVGLEAIRRRFMMVWGLIWKGIKAVFGPIIKYFGDLFKKHIVPTFKSGVERIGKIWDGLKALARKPVEFLVNTVYMKGIRPMMNKIPGVNLPEAHFAKGGVLPGYTPGRDVHTFVSPTGGALHLSGGEAIMRPEFTRAVGGKKGIDRLNAIARAGKAFASGGVWYNGTRSQHTSGYPWARWAGDINGPNEPGAPVPAYKMGQVAFAGWGGADSYGNYVRINHPSGERTLYAHLESMAVRAGQNVLAGQTIGRVGSTGNSSGPHLHFEIAGGSDAINFAGASAKGMSKREKKENSILSAIKELPGLARTLYGHIQNFGSTGWGKVMKDAAVQALRDAVGTVDNKIPNWGPIPNNPVADVLKKVGIFDNGGILEPGKFAYNASTRPEAVFNQKQFKSFAESAGNGGLPKRLTLVVDGEEFNAYVRDAARDEIYSETRYSDNRRRAYA